MYSQFTHTQQLYYDVEYDLTSHDSLRVAGGGLGALRKRGEQSPLLLQDVPKRGHGWGSKEGAEKVAERG